MLRTDELDYDLPDDLIARHPAHPRDAARLLVVSRSDPALLHDRHVRDLPDYLRPGDALVLNTTRVLPARFRGERIDSRGKVDGLYIAPAGPTTPERPGPAHWAVLLKGRRIKPGVLVRLFERDGTTPSGLALRIIDRHHGQHTPGADTGDHDPDSGGWIAALEPEAGFPPDLASADAPTILARIGLTPLPPYIRQARKRQGEGDADPAADDTDRSEYQTVFADPARAASVAAPTAGLHFTPDLLARLESKGIRRAEVILHVGLGTFKPVETEYVEQHPMHAEWCEVPALTRRTLAQTRAAGGRIVAVGTTTARTLESFGAAVFDDAPATAPLSHHTRLLITPGYRWQVVDILMTNFHLPRTTLMAMVAARLGDDGPHRLRTIYAHAVRQRYRFYSYGDAMLVLP